MSTTTSVCTCGSVQNVESCPAHGSRPPGVSTAKTVTIPTAAGSVQGRCPACGSSSLFLGSGGYVTCSIAECKDPGAASDVLNGRYEAMRRAVEFLEILADGGELLVNGVPWREMFRRFNAIVADGVVLDA